MGGHSSAPSASRGSLQTTSFILLPDIAFHETCTFGQPNSTETSSDQSNMVRTGAGTCPHSLTEFASDAHTARHSGHKGPWGSGPRSCASHAGGSESAPRLIEEWALVLPFIFVCAGVTVYSCPFVPAVDMKSLWLSRVASAEDTEKKTRGSAHLACRVLLSKGATHPGRSALTAPANAGSHLPACAFRPQGHGREHTLLS